MREKILEYLLNNFDSVMAAVEKMEPKKQVAVYKQLMDYGIAPVMPEPAINFDRLTEDEMDNIIKILKDAATKQLRPYPNPPL